jgi:hypothetical protein
MRPGDLRRRARLLPALLASPLLAGCTALGVSAAGLGGAMIGASTGAAIKAGTEYELGGTVVRTFTAPLSTLRQAAVRTFTRLWIEVGVDPDRTDPASSDPDNATLMGRVRHRTVTVRFEALTDVLTRVRVTVRRSFLVNDVATADEILAQLDATLDTMTDEPDETTDAGLRR